MEIAECQRLVKGYGDTHARGLKNFERLMSAAKALASAPQAAAHLRRWHEAALKDEDGVALARELAEPSSPTALAAAS